MLDNSNILYSLLMKAVFQLFVSASVDFIAALGKRINPCHVQKKKRMQALIDLYLAATLAVDSASGQAGTQLGQEIPTKWQTRLGLGNRVELSSIFRKQIPIWAGLLCHEIISHEFPSCSKELHCLWSVYNGIVVSFAFNVFKRTKLQWVSANLPGTQQK